MRRLATLFLISVFWATCAQAEEAIWQSYPNHLSIITAGTHDRDATAFTLGVDYERRLNGFLGIGGVVEHAFPEIKATTFLAVADLHLWRGLAAQTGPGVELVDGDEEEEDAEEFVYRIGALYEIEIGRATLSPQVHYDFTTGRDAIIFGGAVGFNF